LIHINFRGMARWHIGVTGLPSMPGTRTSTIAPAGVCHDPEAMR
jgi:hypothetical protein